MKRIISDKDMKITIEFLTDFGKCEQDMVNAVNKIVYELWIKNDMDLKGIKVSEE